MKIPTMKIKKSEQASWKTLTNREIIAELLAALEKSEPDIEKARELAIALDHRLENKSRGARFNRRAF